MIGILNLSEDLITSHRAVYNVETAGNAAGMVVKICNGAQDQKRSSPSFDDVIAPTLMASQYSAIYAA